MAFTDLIFHNQISQKLFYKDQGKRTSVGLVWLLTIVCCVLVKNQLTKFQYFTGVLDSEYLAMFVSE